MRKKLLLLSTLIISLLHAMEGENPPLLIDQPSVKHSYSSLMQDYYEELHDYEEELKKAIDREDKAEFLSLLETQISEIQTKTAIDIPLANVKIKIFCCETIRTSTISDSFKIKFKEAVVAMDDYNLAECHDYFQRHAHRAQEISDYAKDKYRCFHRWANLYLLTGTLWNIPAIAGIYLDIPGVAYGFSGLAWAQTIVGGYLKNGTRYDPGMVCTGEC